MTGRPSLRGGPPRHVRRGVETLARLTCKTASLIRVLTNPGANIPAELLAPYDVALTSSSIVVDGETHDVRSGARLEDVDAWVAGAREFPYVLGTSAAEFVKRYVELGADRGTEVLVVMSSRKIIQSYDAACSAVRTLTARASARINVVDSAMTDLGMGLPMLAAAAAAKEGATLDEATHLTEAMAAAGRFVFVPRTLDNLVKGGRASFLRGWLAQVLGVRPVLAFVEGEAGLVSKCSAKADHCEVIADQVETMLHAGGPSWVGISHGGVPEDAQRLADLLRERFDPQLLLVREISPSVYLHAGPKCLGAVVFPLGGLPFVPRIGT